MLNGPKVNQGPVFRRFPIPRCREHGQQEPEFPPRKHRSVKRPALLLPKDQRISLSAIGGKVLKS